MYTKDSQVLSIEEAKVVHFPLFSLGSVMWTYQLQILLKVHTLCAVSVAPPFFNCLRISRLVSIPKRFSSF